MQNKLLLIFVGVVLIMSGEANATSDAVEKKELLNNPGSIINAGASAASGSIFKKQGAETQAASIGAAGADTISSDVVQCNTERDLLYVSLSNKGLEYTQEGRYDDAVGVLKQAIAIRPDMPHAYINLANAYYHFGKYELAITTSQIVIRVSPANANAYGILGNAYTALGKDDEARENYWKALELFRKDGNAQGAEKIKESLAELSRKK